ncbi:MAG TPA: DUF3822 family protein [Bacteroidales bacterium]|nr:DUF3822 family protein [Bacteroidales bacterium]
MATGSNHNQQQAPDSLAFAQFVDPKVNIAFASQYHLTLRLLPEGLAFSITDHSQRRVLSLESHHYEPERTENHSFGSTCYLDWLKSITSKNQYLNVKYSSVTILTGGIKYTLIPPPLFDPESRDLLLQFNHPLLYEDRVFHDLLRLPSLYVVYALTSPIDQWINEFFPVRKRMHVLSALICTLHSRSRSEKKLDQVYVNVQNKIFDVLLFRNGTLYYCNSFPYQSSNDLIYYLLFVIEQLQVNNEQLLFYMMGRVSKDDEIFDMLRSYINSPEIIPENTQLQYSPVIDSSALPCFYDLLNASTCG